MWLVHICFQSLDIPLNAYRTQKTANVATCEIDESNWGARMATITEIHLKIWVWVDAEFNGELNELCGLSISASSPEIFD